MKLGLILVASRHSNLDHTYAHTLKNLPVDLQTLVWNARGDFVNFVNAVLTTGTCIPKMIISDTVSHLEISRRTGEIEWFVNCDVILIVNYGKVSINLNNSVLELLMDSSEDLTVLYNTIPVKIDNKKNLDSELISLMSSLRVSGKHQAVMDVARKVEGLISPRNKHLVWFEESISGYYSNDKEGGKKACEKILEVPEIEEWMRNNVTKNLQFY